MYLNRLILLFTIFLTLIGCTAEPQLPSYETELLYGRWELTDAWRRHKKTEMLIGTYYEFDQQGFMRTNFPTDMESKSHPYEFDGRSITLKDKEGFIYRVDSLTNSTLIFSTTYSNFPFKLAFSKKDSTLITSGEEL